MPPPPTSLGLDPFYKKYLDVGGLPVVASDKVSNESLSRAREMIEEMLSNRPEILATLAKSSSRVTVVADVEVITDIPEFRDIYETNPGTDWNSRVQGGGIAGGTGRAQITAVWEGNILCNGNDVFPHEDIFVHEFAHIVLSHGVERQPGGEKFRIRLETAFRAALDVGLWENTYAAENSNEYWAEGVQSWFGLNDPPGPIHNNINTRPELETYDPTLESLIREVFGETEVPSSCHEPYEPADNGFEFSIQGVISGPDGQPLEGIGLWAWQGEIANSGDGTTGSDGTFYISVPEGSFSLDLYAGSPGGCIGWLDSSGSITTQRAERVKVLVDGASVSGIEIVLPESPVDMPRITC